jgi:hypothetical protein
MNTWPNRGASGGPCGGLAEEKTEQPKQSDHVGLTQANRPPRNPVRFNVYYWETLEGLQVLMKDPSHLLAKAGHAKWLGAYRVVIAEVQREYGAKGLGLTAVP